MKSVLLRLDAPMQAWGTQSRFEERDTDAEPSKSGVVGLVGAALGMPRSDKGLLARLAALDMVVRVDREGTVLRDYHTAGGGKFCGREYGVARDDGKLVTVVTYRYYLADAAFLVALAGDDVLVTDIARALNNPVFPIFLGRKAFVPAAPIAEEAEPVDGSPLDVLKAHPYKRQPVVREEKDIERKSLRFVVECGPEGKPRSDLPLSFEPYNRSWAIRYVKNEWHEVPIAKD